MLEYEADREEHPYGLNELECAVISVSSAGGYIGPEDLEGHHWEHTPFGTKFKYIVEIDMEWYVTVSLEADGVLYGPNRLQLEEKYRQPLEFEWDIGSTTGYRQTGYIEVCL